MADSSYVPVRRGFSHLAVVMDAYSKRIVKYGLTCSHDTELMLDALGQAKGVIHHFDQDSQYSSGISTPCSRSTASNSPWCRFGTAIKMQCWMHCSLRSNAN